MLTRFLLLASAAAVGITNASDLSGFDVEYDIVTVTVEHELELLKRPVDQVAPAFDRVGALYHALVVDTEKDIKSGKLTWGAHLERVDKFLSTADSYIPMSTLSYKLLNDTEIDLFAFKENYHAATWDVLYYGASEANDEAENDKIASALKALDKEMKTAVKKAKTEELQKKVDAFFDQAESLSTGFKDLAETAVDELYNSVLDEANDEAADDGERESK